MNQLLGTPVCFDHVNVKTQHGDNSITSGDCARYTVWTMRGGLSDVALCELKRRQPRIQIVV